MSEIHEHDFADGEWPFSCPVATPAFSSARVVHEGHPILAASMNDKFADPKSRWLQFSITSLQVQSCLRPRLASMPRTWIPAFDCENFTLSTVELKTIPFASTSSN